MNRLEKCLPALFALKSLKTKSTLLTQQHMMCYTSKQTSVCIYLLLVITEHYENRPKRSIQKEASKEADTFCSPPFSKPLPTLINSRPRSPRP